jgi:hypothetical protein
VARDARLKPETARFLLVRALLADALEVRLAQQSGSDGYSDRDAPSAAPGGGFLGSGVLGMSVLGMSVLLAPVLFGCGGGARSEPGAGAGTDVAQVLSAADPNPGGRPAADDVSPGPISAPRPPQSVPEDVSVQLTGDTFPIGSSRGLVAGALYLANSPLGTTIELSEATGRLCVRGELDVVPAADYANYWGSELGLLLVSNPAAEAPPAEALDTPGFAFRLEGALPSQLRFRVGAAGEIPVFSQYCQQLPLNTGTRIEVPLGALTYECWLSGGRPFPDASGATLLSWQMPANEATADAFDFCIEDIRAL